MPSSQTYKLLNIVSTIRFSLRSLYTRTTSINTTLLPPTKLSFVSTIILVYYRKSNHKIHMDAMTVYFGISVWLFHQNNDMIDITPIIFKILKFTIPFQLFCTKSKHLLMLK